MFEHRRGKTWAAMIKCGHWWCIQCPSYICVRQTLDASSESTHDQSCPVSPPPTFCVNMNHTYKTKWRGRALGRGYPTNCWAWPLAHELGWTLHRQQRTPENEMFLLMELPLVVSHVHIFQVLVKLKRLSWKHTENNQIHVGSVFIWTLHTQETNDCCGMATEYKVDRRSTCYVIHCKLVTCYMWLGNVH